MVFTVRGGAQGHFPTLSRPPADRNTHQENDHENEEEAQAPEAREERDDREVSRRCRDPSRLNLIALRIASRHSLQRLDESPAALPLATAVRRYSWRAMLLPSNT
jgi:hypothetical protein